MMDVRSPSHGSGGFREMPESVAHVRVGVKTDVDGYLYLMYDAKDHEGVAPEARTWAQVQILQNILLVGLCAYVMLMYACV
jgi:hypothetical protein